MINILENKEYTLYKKDANGREINIYKLKNVILNSDHLFYPNVILQSDKQLYNPIEEKIMSLKDFFIKKNLILTEEKIDVVVDVPVFYFVYNTDNYYHFVYDTLPYLISFFDLKKKIKNLKLLMNYPNFESKSFYKFVTEFLNLLGINTEDIILIKSNTLYKEIYISSSYTHGINSNLPPRNEIYNFFKSIVDSVKQKYTSLNLPKKIYISRRTWLHNDFSNIGTNYTQRRRMENENELVKYLESLNYKEIFTERLSTIEKILLFSNVENVVAPIGGGSCNVLFSNETCKHFCIVSPTFLDVNYRFKFSLDKVNTTYFHDTYHSEANEFKKNMRVTNGDLVGEIVEIYDNSVDIIYTKQIVAGWNSKIKYEKINLKKSELKKLDNGLNSSFYVNLKNIEEYCL